MASEHTCWTCKWFSAGDARYSYEPGRYGEAGATRGACHLNAPTREGFPPTRSTAFCGQHSALTAATRGTTREGG